MATLTATRRRFNLRSQKGPSIGSLVTAEKNTDLMPPPMGMLVIPELTSHKDAEIVKGLQGAQQMPWRSWYYRARKAQKAQQVAWKKLCKEIPDLAKPEAKAGAEAVLEKHDVYFIKFSKELKTINQQIEKHNIKLGGNSRGKDFGKVEISPLRQVALLISELPYLSGEDGSGDTVMDPQAAYENDLDAYQKAAANLELTNAARKLGAEQFSTIIDNQDLNSNLSELYSQAYSLQLFANSKLDNPENSSSDEDIEQALLGINKGIMEVVGPLNKGDGFGMVRLPGIGSFPLDGSSEYDGDVFEDGPPLPVSEDKVPKRVQQARAEIGGSDGLLAQILQKMDEKFQINDEDLKSQWQQHVERIKYLTRKEGIPESRYIVNLPQLKIFREHKEKIDIQGEELKKDPGNAELQKQYNKSRNHINSILASVQLPANYLDAVVPTPLKALIPPTKNSIAPSEDIISVTRNLFNESLVESGVLGKVLQSRFLTEEDQASETQMVLALENMAVAAGTSHGHEDLKDYEIDSTILEKWQELAQQFWMDQSLGARDEVLRKIQQEQPILFRVLQSIPDETQDNGVPDEIQDHGTSTVAKPHVQDLPESDKPLRDKRVQPRPQFVAGPGLYSNIQFLAPVVTSGFIQHTVKGRTIDKEIKQVREFKLSGGKVGHQVLVSWLRPGFTSHTFEWVKGSDYKSEALEFLRSNGEPGLWKVGTREDLEKIEGWSKEVQIGGLVFANRDPNKTYKLDPGCHMLLLHKSIGAKWFAISLLRIKLGVNRTNEERLAFSRQSGQLIPSIKKKSKVVDEEDEEGAGDTCGDDTNDEEDPVLSPRERRELDIFVVDDEDDDDMGAELKRLETELAIMKLRARKKHGKTGKA